MINISLRLLPSPLSTHLDHGVLMKKLGFSFFESAAAAFLFVAFLAAGALLFFVSFFPPILAAPSPPPLSSLIPPMPPIPAALLCFLFNVGPLVIGTMSTKEHAC